MLRAYKCGYLYLQYCLASDFIMFGLLSTDAAVNSNTSPSQSSSINDISSMSTEQTLASDTDSSLDALTGPLEGCRWSARIADLISEKNSCFHWAWIACKLMEPSRKTPCSACCAKVMPVFFFTQLLWNCLLNVVEWKQINV